jgi:hypothetical protein
MMLQVVEGWNGVDPDILPCSAAELGISEKILK